MHIDILEQHIDDYLIKRVDSAYFTINNYKALNNYLHLEFFTIRFWVRKNNSNDYALRISDYSSNYYYLKWPDDFYGPEDENFLSDLSRGCSMEDAMEKLLNIIIQNYNIGHKYGLK